MTKCLSCFIVFFFLTSSDIQVYKKNTIPRYRNMKKISHFETYKEHIIL